MREREREKLKEKRVNENFLKSKFYKHIEVRLYITILQSLNKHDKVLTVLQGDLGKQRREETERGNISLLFFQVIDF